MVSRNMSFNEDYPRLNEKENKKIDFENWFRFIF